MHYRAQREHRLAISGIYGRMRHPQYVALVLILFGFLLQWPTILMVMAGCVRGHLRLDDRACHLDRGAMMWSGMDGIS